MNTKDPSKTDLPGLVVPTEASKKKKLRSPSYPYLNLEQAVKFVFILWKEEKRGAAAIPVVASHWGYAAKSSAGLLSVAALKKFGLLIEEGAGDKRTVRLSEAALEIVKYEDAPEEQRKYLKAAALRPSIHRLLWASYQDASEATIRRHLIFDLKFTDTAANSLIKEYKETVAYAKLSSSDKFDDTSAVDEDTSDTEAAPRASSNTIKSNGSPANASESVSGAGAPVMPSKSAPAAQGDLIDIPVPLPSGKIAYYRVPRPMSLDDFTFFKMLLNTMQRGLVKSEEPTAPASEELTFPFTAMWRNADSDMPVTIVGIMGELNGETYYRSESGTGIPASQVDRSVDVGDDEEI